MPSIRAAENAARTSRFPLLVVAALLVAASGASSAAADTALFHNGGRGNCEGCHAAGSTGGGGAASAGFAALLGSDASSTCLRCHQQSRGILQNQEHLVATPQKDLGIGSPPQQMTPGGDFAWLTRDYVWFAEGAREESSGERHGHNIIAADYGYAQDSRFTTAPGGSFPARSLSCISCHDPHGNYRRSANGSISSSGLPIKASGSYNTSPDPDATHSVSVYRLLGGKGYQPKDSGITFTADPPAAVAPASYNREESSSETRVAYGSGVSEWCGNCHATIHEAGVTGANQHVSGRAALMGRLAASYNTYIASGNLGGSISSAYSSLVPFEMGSDDYATLKATANSDGSDRRGANANSRVMCLSCHRAHASGWDSAARWNMGATFIVYNGAYPATDSGTPASLAQGRGAAEVRNALYGRKASSFGYYQRSLCNKCHAKD